ncbi:MAG: hypothetical protein GY754_22565 [bacterium]|nr:hypothetical protein [bacterium]
MFKKLLMATSMALILFAAGCFEDQKAVNKTDLPSKNDTVQIGVISTCSQYTSTNFAHVVEGRAYCEILGSGTFSTRKYYAKGSNNFLGFFAETVQTVHKNLYTLGGIRWYKGTCSGGYDETFDHTSAGHLVNAGEHGILICTSPYPEVGNSRRTIITFDTSYIPDEATITEACLTLNVRSGADFSYHPDDIIIIDVKTGFFGAADYTQADDYGNPDGSDADAYSTPENPIAMTSIYEWISGPRDSSGFNAAGRNAINKTGLTQIRLRSGGEYGYTSFTLIDYFPELMQLHVKYEY